MQEPREATTNELMLIKNMRDKLEDLYMKNVELDERDLLRFLRARNHSVEKAENMFRKHIEWREKNDLDHFREWYITPEYRSIHWRWYVTGFDRLGNPVVVLPVGTWEAAKVKQEGFNDSIRRYTYHSIESVWCFMQWLSEKEKVTRQCTVLLDLKELSWRAVTTIEAVHGFLESLKCFEANYPETLHVGFLFNAPYAFNLGWKLARPFLSEHTQRKLRFITSSDSASWREELSQVISPDQCWQMYGGDLPDYQEINFETRYRSKALTIVDGHTTGDEYDCCNNR